MKKFATGSMLALFTLCLSSAAVRAASPVPIGAQDTTQAEHPAGAAAHAQEKAGAESYAAHCSMCHGEQRQGNPPAFPSLLGVKRKMTDPQIVALIHNGRGRMPAIATLPAEEVASIVQFLGTPGTETAGMVAAGEAAPNTNEEHSSDLAESGKVIFQQNCAFCHGRDAMGGESGPDLTRSKLALADVNGDKISVVVSQGRIEKKMPAFNFSSQELLSIAAYIHAQQAASQKQAGGRKGVDVADLQTGNVEAGRQYFNGAGTCSQCHSGTGDLAGIATRYEGLQLERRMLYPEDVKNKVTVTLPSGQVISGTVAYLDEFTLGLIDADGTYHSWSIPRIKYKVDAPVNAHAELFSKYTDDDIHNLMAYLQTMR